MKKNAESLTPGQKKQLEGILLKKDKEFSDALEEVLDEYFPKMYGSPKKAANKRSQALMLFVAANQLHQKRMAEEVKRAREDEKKNFVGETVNLVKEHTARILNQFKLGMDKVREETEEVIIHLIK